MVKKYGGYTGNPQASDVTTDSAHGAWQAPSEVTRESGLQNWPSLYSPSIFVYNNVGEVTYAATSGSAFDCLTSGTYLIPSGQIVSRSTYSDLFNVIGEDYGAGDGSTTFQLPDYSAPYLYLKATVPASPLTRTTASGQGVVPYHTHTFYNVNNVVGGVSQGQFQAPNSANQQFFNSYLQGRYDGNRGCTMEMVPVIAVSNTRAPAGVIAPLLVPNLNLISSVLPSNCLVCSGQQVSRTTYAHLYEKFGNIFGQGDGSTTFNIPDLRGLFVSTPFYDIVQPSGHAQPSGFVPHSVAAHTHQFQTWSTNNNGATAGPSYYRGSLQAGDSSLSNIGSTEENRPDNVTCVYILVVE